LRTALWSLMLGSVLLLALALWLEGRRHNEGWGGRYTKMSALILAGAAAGTVLVLWPLHLTMSASASDSLFIPVSAVFTALLVPDRRLVKSCLIVAAGCVALALFFYWQQPVKPVSNAFWWSMGAPGPLLAAAVFLVLYAAARFVMRGTAGASKETWPTTGPAGSSL
jgi:hypothetical protein